MQKTGKTSIQALLTDRFASEWKLLSETESFLSHTPDFAAYETQFKTWRQRLQNKQTTDSTLTELRSEIVELRKALRLQGYDLSLGSQRLVVRGFRNDDSLAEGFRRVVLCFCEENVYYQTGSANHVAIGEELMDTLTKRSLLYHPETHYLWYLRTSKDLFISGSATERKEDFERLEDRAAANPLKLLSALKSLS